MGGGEMVKAGDRIRVFQYIMGIQVGTRDYTLEMFRDCLGFFRDEDHRLAQEFTPICELYEPAPDSEDGYIPNHGPYKTKWVPAFMELPTESPKS